MCVCVRLCAFGAGFCEIWFCLFEEATIIEVFPYETHIRIYL